MTTIPRLAWFVVLSLSLVAADDDRQAPRAASTPIEVAAAPKAPAPEGSVKLEPVTFDEFLSRIASNKAKYSMVDAWATWCGPCRKNFPHVVAMNKKYGGKGLAVVSLSLDDPADAKLVGEAKQFLNEQKATFTNFILKEADGVGFEKLDVNTIPAVFIYGPDGKLVKKFSWDDPNNQFTYEQVEEAVIALLDGKPLPKDDKAGSKK